MKKAFNAKSSYIFVQFSFFWFWSFHFWDTKLHKWTVVRCVCCRPHYLLHLEGFHWVATWVCFQQIAFVHPTPSYWMAIDYSLRPQMLHLWGFHNITVCIHCCFFFFFIWMPTLSVHTALLRNFLSVPWLCQYIIYLRLECVRLK